MAPLGYHVELLSDHYFILTNENAVFVHMSDVSHLSIYTHTALIFISIFGQYLFLYHVQESKLMISHSNRVIGNLLDMVATPVTTDMTSDSLPLQDQVTKMVEVQLEDQQIRKHLYEVCYTNNV